MERNAYFQLVNKAGQTWLQVICPDEACKMFVIDELIAYLDRKNITKYDLVQLDRYIKAGKFDEPFLLLKEQGFPESEELILKIEPKALAVVARFYPPSTDGQSLDKAEVLRTLEAKGVKYGISEEVIDEFFKERKYCTDYKIATAKLPVEGKNAELVYHFDTNATARPLLNEDGSVDFHKLGNIKPVKQGEKLATLIPENLGKPGINVLGTEMLPQKVQKKKFRYNRNIQLSEDGLQLLAKVAGHVTLVDDMIIVSDIYPVAEDVDVATGDIEYFGTVQIRGNVRSGYKIKAEGDVVVEGIVEGAIIESGGNVILRNGMQGMSKGEIHAKGNVVAKYLQNCKVYAEGAVMSDAVVNSEVVCSRDVKVCGKKGLITGGSVTTCANIYASNVGSNMGIDTKLEILSNIDMAKELKSLEKQIQDLASEIKKMDQTIILMNTRVKSGEKLTKEQENQVKLIVVRRKKKFDEVTELSQRAESLEAKLELTQDVRIYVDGIVYSGVKVVIKDIMKIMRETVRCCQFIREGADIVMRSNF